MERVQRISTHLTSSVLADPNADAVSLLAADLFSVKGKIALVTGGSKGIGKMIAKGLAMNGAKVFICSRKANLCEETAKEINDLVKSNGGQGEAQSLPGDLSSIEGVEKVVQDLTNATSVLNILVNNAGATYGAPLEDYPDSAWQKVMDLNVRHLFNLTQKCLPLLKKGSSFSDPGRVVNIASVDGVRATQTFGPTAAFAYTVSKAAVVHLTNALCRALAEFAITVNCIAPGLFPSNMTKFLFKSEATQEFMKNANPLKRNGQTSDIAGTVLYLCSPAGNFTNGVTIVLDGGKVHFSDLDT